MTLEEVQAKLEAGIQNSTVTMEGDGCNCSDRPNFEKPMGLYS
jgi:hypothetical protein